MADVATRLAFKRTLAAYERTMMAWVRTATSLITFGFSIYKFFQFEAQFTKLNALLVGPKEFAILMVAAGLIALVLAVWDYLLRVRTLRAQCPDLPRSRAMIIVAAVGLLGIVAVVAIVR